MVFPLWSDGTLDDLIRSGTTFHLSDVVTVMRRLAQAISVLVSVRIGHCDLSTRNVVVKVKRAGCSGLDESEEEGCVAGGGSGTRLSIADAAVIDLNLACPLGTHFRPEFFKKRKAYSYNSEDDIVTPKTDIFSLGKSYYSFNCSRTKCVSIV